MDLPELYRDIVETSPDGIWVFDLEGTTLYANTELARMYGVPRDRFAHVTVFDTLDEPGRAQFSEHLRAVRRGELNDSEVECQFVRHDGSTTWILVRESALRSPAGSITAILHRITEFTDRRATINELEASRERLAEAQRIARVGSWDWDVVADEITASAWLSEIYGLTDETFPHTYDRFLAMVHPDDLGHVEHAVATAAEAGDDFVFVARIKGRDSWIWTRGRGIVRRNEQGEVVSMSGTHQDITEVKEAEIALLDLVRQNVLMQAVASAANEAHTLTDVLGQAGSMVVLHDDWRRARAFTVTDAGGIVPLYIDEAGREADLQTPEESARELALATLAHESRTSVWSEDRLTIAFNVMYDDVVRAVVTIASDPPLYRHQMIQDMAESIALQLGRVSEREHNQRVLADARDAAMEASRQKSEFLATMSHEIRTPLNGVIGLNDLLLRTALDTEQQRLAAGVQVASRALMSVINDVLDFSKIEAGRLELEQVDFELRPLLEQVASVMAEAARSKGIELVVECDDSVPERLGGDPTRLAQVLSNLLSNAVKFTDVGEVRACARAVPRAEGFLLIVEVSDTGIGIAPEEVPGLFAPFTQADSSTTRLYGGTGLGLAISKEIVEALGGTISYSPHVPSGSTFTFTASMASVAVGAPRPVVAPRPTAPAVKHHRGQHVLVVEDNAVNQMVAGGLLESMGYTVELADDGLAALEVLARRSFDVVLMDVQMPRMDGYAATRALRETEAGGRRTPVIAMTAAAVDGERERCLGAGMDDYLTKPVDPGALGEALTRWAGKPHEHSPVGDDGLVLPSTTPTPPIDGLDVERLDMLRDLDPGNTSYLDRAISNFRANSVTAVETIREHVLADDADKMRQAAHKLAGSALNLGVVASAAAARELEWLGDSGSTEGAVDLLGPLETALDEGRALLGSYQATYGGGS
ncbi:response regulator [Nocardioides sp.]|uniref:response regulator n=1 Tax=Nocardioides sp. TaxID=35761 RepID=UPI00286C132E|nr:response regulator [Nocardioides sp.]